MAKYVDLKIIFLCLLFLVVIVKLYFSYYEFKKNEKMLKKRDKYGKKER